MTAIVIPIKRAKKRLKLESVPGCPDYLKINRATGIYYVRIFRAGKGELKQTTGTTSKSKARTIAEELVAKFIGGQKTNKKRRHVSSILKELDESLGQEFIDGNRREATREKDRHLLKFVEKHFGSEYLDEIDEDFWADWVRSTGKPLKINLFDAAKYLSMVMTFAHRRKYVSRKPVIMNPDKAKKTGRVYTDAEIFALVQAADPKTLSQITLGFECGLRSGEARCLKKEWLTFESDSKVLLALPDDFVKANARTIMLSVGASRLLSKILKADKSGSPFVFPSATDPMTKCESRKGQNKRWRSVVKKSGIKADRAWFRYLRQTFYNKLLLELGLPIQNVSQYGGTSIKTLQRSYLLDDPKNTQSIGAALKISAIRKPLGNRGSK